jgi:hypothetical protein
VADINLGLQIGYETQTISLTSTEWMVVKSGEHFVKDAQGFYEGEEFTYTWYFNDPRFVGTSLFCIMAMPRVFKVRSKTHIHHD